MKNLKAWSILLGYMLGHDVFSLRSQAMSEIAFKTLYMLLKFDIITKSFMWERISKRSPFLLYVPGPLAPNGPATLTPHHSSL